MGGSKEGAGGPDPQRNSQVDICFLRNTGTDPLEKGGPCSPSAKHVGGYKQVFRTLCP